MIIFITGFMGVGKTTIGKQISEILNVPFLDLDGEIEKEEKQSIPSIFKNKGEEYFRVCEQECLKRLISENKQTCIIALGGGTMCYLNNHIILLKNGLVVYLKSTWPAIKERIQTLPNRPMLASLNPIAIKQLYTQREPVYALSQLQTLADTSFTAQKVANWLKLLTNR